MKLLSMKVPAHLRLPNNGTTSAIISQDLTQLRLLQIQLYLAPKRFDANVIKISADQHCIYLKALDVELSRYHNKIGLRRIVEEVSAGSSALDLPFTS